MDIEKRKLEDKTDCITIKKGHKEFKMFFGGNGDLYWQLINEKNIFSDEEFFIIDKENYVLFASFERLYNRIAKCEIYDIDPIELEFCETPEDIAELEEEKRILNESAQESLAYTSLYSESGITFISDEDTEEQSNTVTIVKAYDGESYIIQFTKPSIEKDFLDIRFRTSGSRYRDFIPIFLRQYNELCAEDFDYHQVHIEEYLHQKKLTKSYMSPKDDE